MYVDAIVGGKGSGKTPRMLEEMAREAADQNANIIFIEYGFGDHLVPHAVRRIDIKEYPVRGFGQLIAFLAGITPKITTLPTSTLTASSRFPVRAAPLNCPSS